MGGAYTEAQKRAAAKYHAEHTDAIRLRLPKGTKDLWQAAAAVAGVSMTQFVKAAVDEAIARQEEKC